MAEIQWDLVGERRYETGVDHGVLYLPDSNGNYVTGVAWNGLVNVTETPSGGESNPVYADNMKYLDLYSAEEFGGTIEALTYPPEFEQFDGQASPTPGVTYGQQNRKPFGFAYRTIVGNDVEGNDFGYKLNLVYGCRVAPSEQAHATVNDSPEPVTFSWTLTTTPVAVPGFRPTAIVKVDSTEVGADELADLELMLYGSEGVDPQLPLPAVVGAMMSTGSTAVTPAAPTYNSSTDIITIPGTAGVVYRIDGEPVPAGPFGPITEDTIVTATPASGFVFAPGSDNDWVITFA